VRTRGSYERLADENPDLNVIWPVRPNPGTNRAYQFGIDRPDGSLVKFTSVCGPVVYRGDRLPAELYGNVFVAEPAANLVSRLVLDDTGPELRARKAYERGEFLASTDERFRPVFLSNAPDGTLYVVDMYRGIIEHRISITVYLRDQILARKLDQPTGLGRIYRVVHETTKRDTTRGFSNTTAAELVATLSHPNGWRRDTAQRLLVERNVRAAVPALKRLAAGASAARTRLQALWILDGLDAIEPADVLRALEDGSRDVRTSAVRLAERWLADAAHPVHAALLKRRDDDLWVVRQLAASLGTLPAGAREEAIVAVLERHAADPVVVDAALSGVRGSEGAVLEKLLGAALKPGDSATAPAITMIAAAIVRSAQDGAVQQLFNLTADRDRSVWQRSALLRGAEVALLGAPTPGSSAERARPAPAPAVAAPCPTCPGGRAGPGGEYAFARPEAGSNGPGRARGRGPTLRLSREPAPLSALLPAVDDFGARVAAVLSRVTWPGKPGDAAPVPALTAEQQQRYAAGQVIYRNICQACHQPDGRGLEKVAPSLIGSPLTLAAAEIPARILLNGKEGSIGLMPPIGAAITDEQIASVLTYIRREWGQDGTPVDPAAVQKVRTATAARTRPWTHEELMKLVAEGR
jgi:mono/diheme cytochrome c family protein